MLAVLLLAGGRPVPVETLIDRVWGEASPPEVRQSLHTDISRLRRRLKVNDSPGAVTISAKSHTYSLEVDPESVDVFRSRRLRDQATSIAQSGDLKEAVKLLHDAENLWRSEPLTGLSGNWVEQTRAALDSEYRAMALELVDAELTLGHHSETISYLLGLISRYPLDETFVERLMIAYYRCGRQADALSLYLATMRLLRTEAGADPGPRLQDLYGSILRHDPAIRFRRPPPGGRTAIPNTLPTTVAEFTGRTAEVARLSGTTGPLGGVAAIEGMPGVGKSALAIRIANEMAERYPDARLYLHLHAHDPQRPAETPAAALSTLLRALGVAPGKIPHGLAERARLWRSELAGRRGLIVLDDAAGSEQILPLLPHSPDCHVIITSRKSIDGIDGARRYPLGVLPVEDAMTLLRRIASPAAPLPAAASAEVVELCGCLPLAIRLAATRLRDKQVTSIGALIEQMRDTHEDIAGLQDQALTATFELSYRDLSLAQRRVFRRLGLSPVSELTAPAVSVLSDVSVADTERCLFDLVDHYLLEVISPGRYRLHDLVRQYALARAVREDSEPVRRRAVGQTLDYFIESAGLADRLLYPYGGRAAKTAERSTGMIGFEDAEAAQTWMTAEWRNLFHLVRYGADHEWNTHVIDLADIMAGFLDAAGHWEEAEAVHRCALRVALNLELPQAIGQARLNLAVIQWRTGRTRKALGNASKAQHTYRAVHDNAGEAAALDHIGLILWALSDYRAALAYFGEAHDKYHAVNDAHGEAECLGHIAMALAHTGRYQEALDKLRNALDIFRSLGDVRGQGKTLNNLADALLQLGYHRDAYELYQQSQQIYRTITGRRNHAILLINFGNVDRYRRKFKSALTLYRQALAEFSATGDRINEANVLNNIGVTLSCMDRYNEALIHHKKALSVAGEIGNIFEKVRAHLGIAETDVGLGRYPAAIDNFWASHRLARRIGEPYLEAQALNGIAGVTHLTQGQDAARIYWRQAHDLFTQLGTIPEIESVRLRLEALDFGDS